MMHRQLLLWFLLLGGLPSWPCSWAAVARGQSTQTTPSLRTRMESSTLTRAAWRWSPFYLRTETTTDGPSLQVEEAEPSHLSIEKGNQDSHANYRLLHAQTTAAPKTSFNVLHDTLIAGSNPTSSSPNATSLKRPPWPFEQSDIPLDADIVTGELSNGLRYMAMENNVAPGRLELRLHVAVGSAHEAEGEEGMAHFLEHMAFQSLRSFSGDELMPLLQTLGMDAFGRHSNAYTAFDETVYQLTLPNVANVTLTTCFQIMRDYADGMLFLEEELENERGVVLSELQDTASVSDRIWRRYFDWSLPDHLISHRWPRGLEESIKSFTRQQFVDFYHKYYTPRHMTFVVVGDMNTTAMESLVMEYFSSMVDTGPLPPPPDYGNVSTGTRLRTAVFVDEDLEEGGGDTVYLEAVRSIFPEPDSVARRIQRMQLQVCNTIVGRRLLSMAYDGWSFIDRWYDLVEFGTLWATSDIGLWQAVSAVEMEWRRAKQYGFTQAEIDRVKADTLNEYEQAALSMGTRNPGVMADYLVSSVNGNYVASSPAEDLRIATLAFENCTPEVLLDVYKAYWNSSDMINLYLTTSNSSFIESEDAEILADLFSQSQAWEVEPPVDPEAVVFAYTDFGPTGSVAFDSTQEDLGIRQLILSNHVRVNMKQTDFEDETIHVTVRFGTGKLGQPAGHTFLDEFTSYVMSWSGLGDHSWDDLDVILAGKTCSFSFDVHSGAFTMSGTTNPDDLELQLQLLAAHFWDPGFRDEALYWWQAEVDSNINYIERTLYGKYYYEMNGWLLGGDDRFVAPSRADLLAFNLADAMDWILPQLRNSYLEVSIIGDINMTRTVPLLLQTFGALPARAVTPSQFTVEERSMSLPTTPQSNLFFYETSVPVAATMVVWEVPSLVTQNITEYRHLQVLASVLNDRVYNKLREELGGAYSPQAYTDINDDFDFGFMFMYVEGTRQEMAPFAEVFETLLLNLTGSNGSILEDEVMRAVRPIQTTYQQDLLLSNEFWLSTVLQECQAKPSHLDWVRSHEADFGSINAAGINALARQYLTLDKALRVTILPMNNTVSVGRSDGRSKKSDEGDIH